MTEDGVTAAGMVTARVTAESLKIASLPSVHACPAVPFTVQLASVPFQLPLAVPFQSAPDAGLNKSNASDAATSASPGAGAHGAGSPPATKSSAEADQANVPSTALYRPARPAHMQGRYSPTQAFSFEMTTEWISPPATMFRMSNTPSA